jgi:D-tyrosyl-tRNA(Tyr) deacylase
MHEVCAPRRTFFDCGFVSRCSGAEPPEEAETLYKRFCAELRAQGVDVATGVFGARMAVELVNDRPVTIVLDA